jgi:hypothetical protein
MVVLPSESPSLQYTPSSFDNDDISRRSLWQDALEHARDLAGERVIPAALQIAPKPA